MQLTLNQDIQMPMIGFGTYLITNEDAQSVVLEALRAGYRHIDTAEAYGNEEGVGLAIQAGMQELGLSRETIFVTTKLWPGNDAWGQPVKTYKSTIDSLNQSLSTLKLDYVDLYLIHAPLAKVQRMEQWKALVDLRQMGKVRAIGVSNFSTTHIEEIKSAGLPLPDVNQIELHPWSQKPELTSYLIDHNISISAYSSLVPLSTWRTAPGHDSAKTEAMKQAGDEADAPFKKMAQKYGVSEAQILLRWGLQKGYAILPKSTNKTRIQQNFDVLSFEMDDADMIAIEKMDRGDGVAWSFGDPTKVS
ncbi:aldehyde reductase [Anaerolineae bacterium]|nr:aldehyde reductase [Anaerolineae bacterium]